MDDFSQIIGVILAVAFFLYSAFKKKNAKQLNPITSIIGEEVMDSGLFSEKEGGSFDQENEREKTCFKTHEPIVNKPEGAYEHTNEKIRRSVKPVDNDKNVKKFDLKQAIIYSELLKRKYF